MKKTTKKPRSLLRDISGVLSSNVFAILSALLLGIIIARVLGPEGKGIFTALAIVPAIVVSFAALGMRRTAVVMIGKKEVDQNILASSLLQILIFTSTIGVITSLIVFAILNNPTFSIAAILLTVFVIPFKLAVMYIGGIYIGREEFRFANMLRWLEPLIALFLAILLLIVFKTGIVGAVLTVLVSNICTAFLAFRRLFRDFEYHRKWNLPILKKMAGLGFMFAASLLVMRLFYRVDVLLLEHLSGLKEIGFYSIGVNIAEKMWQLPLAIGVVITSRSANSQSHEAMRDKVAAMVRLSLIAGIFLASVIWFIAPYLIIFLYGKAYTEAIPMLQTILPGVVFFIAFRLMNSHMNGMGQPKYAIYSILPALALNVVLNYFWIPEHGGIGAAMATNVSYAAGTIIMMIFFVRITRVKVHLLFLPQKSDVAAIRKKLKRK